MLKKGEWNKKFLRLRQQADQHLGRAEKTEVLSEDLQLLEKRVEEIRQVCLQTHKKVQQCMQGQGTDVEKRLKKMPAFILSNTMTELSSLQADKLLGSMLKLAGEVEGDLASDQLHSELCVESKVLEPLHSVLENDIPAIMRTKKKLKSLTLDMDSNKNRLQALQKQGVTQKCDAQKGEYEEAVQKVDQCKDQLATEMYTFVSKEADYSNYLLELIIAQKEYHEKALERLEAILPQMQEKLEQSVHMPVYKCLLEDHLRRTNRDIASVLEECICVLFQLGMEEEGLFRIAGSASRVKKLKAAFDSGFVDMGEYIQDIHCISGALKLYLRELPEPLLTYELYDEWIQSIQLPHDQKLQTMWSLLSKLPKSHFNNLRYLVKFLSKLTEHQDVNKMSATNLAIVIGPNLIWPKSDPNTSILITSTQSAIAELLISHADWFFPGEIDFDTHPVPSTPYGASEDFEDPVAPLSTGTNQTGNGSPTSSPSASQSNLAVQHSPEGSLDGVPSGGTSPKPRRKKMAPPPPSNKPERPTVPAPLPPEKGGAGDAPPLQIVVSPPIEKPDKPTLPPSPKPPVQDKPPAVERPQVQPKPVAERKKSSSEEKTVEQGSEKPVNEGKAEKPDRPSSPKFDRPKKPEKPSTLPPPKPDAPPNLQRLGSTKPPRPEPPPPPIPTTQQTVNQNSSTAEQQESPSEQNTYF